MPRPTHVPSMRRSPGYLKPSTPRSLAFLFLSAILLTAAVLPAGAQMPPYNGLPVAVSTDKQVYAPGEAVGIRIKIANPTDVQQVLTFSSTLQADYVIDGMWRWSAGKGFPAIQTSIAIPPGGTFAFPEFAHTPGDFYLGPGRHEIVAEVGRYGRGSTTIAVGDSTPPPPPQFLLSPSVSPNPAPFGTPIDLSVTVTNVSNQILSFGHDGCPVLFSIDRSWKPQFNCPEYWTIVTLQPGESIAFTSAEYPYLTLNNSPEFTLTPGWHEILFEMRGVGSTSARFEVTGDSHAGSISGHVFQEGGAALEGAIVEAYPFSDWDSTRVMGDGTTPYPWQYHQAITGPDGSYVMGDVPAGIWALRAFHSITGAEIWYDQALTRADADPVTVVEDADTDSIEFVLPSSPPPPPNYLGTITGYVFDDPWPLKRASFPLPQAIVAAIPYYGSGVDSGWVPPDDSTQVRPLDGPLPPVRPPYPPYPGGMSGPIYYGFPDSTGLYTIYLPLGVYKVIATAPGFRYEWWNNAADYDSADDVEAWDMRRATPVPPPLTNFSLRPLPPDSLTAALTGVVRGSTPDVPPPPVLGMRSSADVHPIAGARVVARPLIVDPRIMTLVAEIYPAETGADGSYAIRVPAKSPYIVEASADGYATQFYDHAFDPMSARPVDVTPGQVTPGIDFDLYAYGPPPEIGMIGGIVSSENPMMERAVMPLPGARVRLHPATPGYGFEMVTRTDDQGRFSFFGLPTTASFYISAEAPGHVPMYYPRAYRWSAAEPVVPAGSNVRMAPINITLEEQFPRGEFFAVGLVRTDAGVIGIGGGGSSGGGDSTGTGTGTGGSGETGSGSTPGTDWLAAFVAPEDSTSDLWPLPGSFLYLVPAETATDGPLVPVAGAVACQNGTLLLDKLVAGRYKAYADRPGFAPAWFHGTNYLDAAVISVGPGIDPVVIDIVLTPVEGPPPPPGGGGDQLTDAKPRIVTGIRNAPNPFKPQTTIIYRLMDDADVSLDIYDVSGRLVRRIFEGLHQPAGEQHVPWDGNSDEGAPSGAGIYFYRISTPSETSTGKMVMVR